MPESVPTQNRRMHCTSPAVIIINRLTLSSLICIIKSAANSHMSSVPPKTHRRQAAANLDSGFALALVIYANWLGPSGADDFTGP